MQKCLNAKASDPTQQVGKNNFPFQQAYLIYIEANVLFVMKLNTIFQWFTQSSVHLWGFWPSTFHKPYVFSGIGPVSMEGNIIHKSKLSAIDLITWL